jgi:hypothetical protein
MENTVPSGRDSCVFAENTDPANTEMPPNDTGEETGTAGHPTPDWSPTEAIAVAESVLLDHFYGPVALRALYLERMSHGDELCPVNDIDMPVENLHGCTTVDDWWYAGIAIYEEYDADAEYDGTSNSFLLSGDFEIIQADGVTFTVGGNIGRNQTSDPVGWAGYIEGSWLMPTHDAFWLDDGISAMLQTTTSTSGVSMHGGLSIGASTIYADTIEWGREGCWEHPTGVLLVRDPTGYWYTLTYADDCSGCGTIVSSDGSLSAEACPQLGTLRDDIESDLEPE